MANYWEEMVSVLAMIWVLSPEIIIKVVNTKISFLKSSTFLSPSLPVLEDICLIFVPTI